MFQFWGTNSEEVKALVEAVQVRSTANFNWTFIFILAVVFYVYWSEINKKNHLVVYAGLALYGHVQTFLYPPICDEVEIDFRSRSKNTGIV